MKSKTSFYPLIVQDKLDSGIPYLHILSVHKDAKGVRFDTAELGKQHLKLFKMPCQPLLTAFTDEGFYELLQSLERTHKQSRSGVSQDVYIKRSVARTLAENFKEFLNLYQGVIYHKFTSVDGRTLVKKCKVFAEIPAIRFKVGKSSEPGVLELKTVYALNDVAFLESEVKREGVFLQKEDFYYILSYSDYLTLEKLGNKREVIQKYQPEVFLEKIVKPLEEKYDVDKGEVFDIYEIKTQPESVVLLSEISGSFLMITPKWIYDGIEIEGNYEEEYSTSIDGQLYKVFRDKSAESQFLDYLKSQHPSFRRQMNGYFYLSFSDAKKSRWFLKTYHQWIEDNVEVHGMDMLQHFRYSPNEVATQMQVLHQKGSTIELYMKVTFGKEEVELRELRKVLLSNQTYVLLKNDYMGLLTEEWLHAYGVLVKHGWVVDKNVLVIPQWILLSLDQSKLADKLQLSISQDWWERWRKWQSGDEVVVNLPPSVQAELRPYQTKGFEWMCQLADIGAGALLADDMGLGKTLQTIAFMAYRADLDSEAKFIVICPTTLIYNWSQEIQKFSNSLFPYIYHSSSRDLQDFFDSDKNVLITSYGVLRSDIEQLSVLVWETTVLDESHHIKNRNAIVTKAVAHLQAHTRVALSGTPVMNNTEDLYTQLNFLLPGYLGTIDFFRKEYAIPIDRTGDAKKKNALQKLINPFVLRRTKNQVAEELPDKVVSVLWCDMDEEQRACYEETKNSIRSSIFLDIHQSGLGKSKLSVLQGITKLRQICAAPSLVKDIDCGTTESVKLDVLLSQLQSIEGHKALVFSQYLGMLDLIEHACAKANISTYRIDGSVNKRERMELVNSFQSNETEVSVFLISMGAGSVGLTLTAADYVFLMDPWWNTALENQAIDRTHRIGQTQTVFAHKMICTNSIEEKILLLQEKKQSLSDDLIGAEEGFVKQLTEEDIAFLFE